MRKQDQLLGTGFIFLKAGNNLPERMLCEAPATQKCGTRTSRITITREPARDAGSWALLQTHSIRISRDLWFNKLPNNLYTHSHFKTP